MTHAELITRALEQGIDHATFAARAEERAAAVDGSDPYLEYRKLNVARMQRQTKTYVPSDAMRTAMQGITAPQTWVCITEDWCGDSSQTEPIIAAILMPLTSISIVSLAMLSSTIIARKRNL